MSPHFLITIDHSNQIISNSIKPIHFDFFFLKELLKDNHLHFSHINWFLTKNIISIYTHPISYSFFFLFGHRDSRYLTHILIENFSWVIIFLVYSRDRNLLAPCFLFFMCSNQNILIIWMVPNWIKVTRYIRGFIVGKVELGKFMIQSTRKQKTHQYMIKSKL